MPPNYARLSSMAVPALPRRPTPEDLHRSAQLSARLTSLIAAEGGWLRFDDWMRLVLYEPSLGYYVSGPSPFGPTGDFITAPEMSPLFGRCLAAQCAQWFEKVPPVLIEVGAGSGVLAAQLLRCLTEMGCPPQTYLIVEPSATLQSRQRACLATQIPSLLNRVKWCEELPPRVSGVVIANELLDAMPVRLFHLAVFSTPSRCVGRIVWERGVAAHPSGDGFVFADRLADTDYSREVLSRTGGWLREVGLGEVEAAVNPWGFCGEWVDCVESLQSRPERGALVRHSFLSEIGFEAQSWVETVGARLERGVVLLIDYGFSQAQFYHPQRDKGTLRCHYRHRAGEEVLTWPGLQDITAHVDWTAMAQQARLSGLRFVGFTSQANFLLNCGILDTLQVLHAGCSAKGWAGIAGVAHQLLSEAQMGELVKVAAFHKGFPEFSQGSVGFSKGGRVL